MNFIHKSIRAKIFASLIAIVALVVVLSSSMGYFVTRNYIENRFLSEINTMVSATEKLLDDVIGDANSAIEAASYQMGKPEVFERNQLNRKVVEESLRVIKYGIANATTLYYGDEEGGFYMYPNRFIDSQYDPRTRDWYALAKSRPGLIQWSAPYSDIGTGELVITGAKSILLEGASTDKALSGVIGIDILLSDVQSLLSTTEIGSTGDLMLVSATRQILLSKDTSLVGLSLDQINLSLGALQDNEQFSDGTFTYFMRQLGNKSYYVMARVSNDEIRNLSRITALTIASLGFGALLIAILVGQSIATRLTNPILALTQSMREVRQGNLLVRCDESSKDEVGELIEGFNDMLADLHAHEIEMQALYQELYSSEETLKEQYDELYQNRELVKESEARYKLIFEASKEGLWMLSPNGGLQLFSKDWYANFNMDLDHPTLIQWQNLIHPEDRPATSQNLDNLLAAPDSVYSHEFRVLAIDGSYRWVQSVAKAIYDSEGNWLHIVGSHIDVTLRRESEAKIRALAYKDALTGLGNRFLLQDFLELEIVNHHQGAILLIDLDNFKYINDTFGHSMGDFVLKETAHRLRQIVKADVQLIRFSGDEFVLVLCNVVNRQEIAVFIEHMLNLLKENIVLDSRVIKVSASVGVALYPHDARDLNDLLRYADLAMFAAKERSEEEYVFYDENFKARVLGRIQMENYLKSALAYEEIYMVYQPIIQMPNQQIEGFEALMRWKSPQWGLVSPDTFIPIAEKTGLIVNLGLYALETALKFIKRVNRERYVKGYDDKERLKVAVNLSVVQLMHARFEHDLLQLFDIIDVPYSDLKLEITESLALERDLEVMTCLQNLKQRGISISLDDFGSGHSSINNLLNLPIDTLKIDKMLVQKIVEDRHVSAMIAAVISYCEKTGIQTVAEGVETDLQSLALTRMGFNAIQGYYYSKPVKEVDVHSLMASWSHDPLTGGIKT